MKALIIIFAALAPSGAGAPSGSQPFKFACVGKGKSEGYPYGVRKIGETSFRIEGEGQQVAIVRQGENMCPTGAACAAMVSLGNIRLQISDVPNHDPGYSSRFQLDRKSLRFEASGEGLDGGWSIAGKCRPERR